MNPSAGARSRPPGLPRQFALPFPHEPDYRRVPFLDDASNAAALTWLGRPEAWPNRRLLLWGETGCGKSHLLARWSDAAQGAIARGPDLDAWPERSGDPAGAAPVIAIDDADLAPEEQLLHALNAAAEAGSLTLLSARTPPARWAIRLPDVASRLRAITAVEIGRPGDALLRLLLSRLLRERQLVVPQPVQDWLLARLPRTPGAIREATARLDRLALAAGTHVSRATAAAVLAAMASEQTLPEDEDGDDTAGAGLPVTGSLF